MYFFSLILLHCDFNINSMPYSVSPTFFTPYDAQASSACSAFIIGVAYRLGFYGNLLFPIMLSFKLDETCLLSCLAVFDVVGEGL